MTTIFTEEAEEILDSNGLTARQLVSEHRWYTKELIVFRAPTGDHLLGFYYLKPASELQEDQERFESDPVQVFPVYARNVMTAVYEKDEE